MGNSASRFGIRANSRLAKRLGADKTALVILGLGAFERILPHIETQSWKVVSGSQPSKATWVDTSHKELRLNLGISDEDGDWRIQAVLRRRKVATGAGAISRTLDSREHELSNEILRTLAALLQEIPKDATAALRAVQLRFDETVVASHLQVHHGLEMSLSDWFTELRGMSEQTYENKALTFGCIVDKTSKATPNEGCRFPEEFVARKRFRALSDGFRTAYLVSSAGAILRFMSVRGYQDSREGFYPEWSEELVVASQEYGFGLSLTRQGDILVFDGGRLTFTYRCGRWQYWNHAHIVDLLKNKARAQHVQPTVLSRVIRAIYRASLDVAFRRSGALFVLLRNTGRTNQIVREGDAVGSQARSKLDTAFDLAVAGGKITGMPRSVVSELAAIDGAVVVGNNGKLLAYGAVLEPKKKGRISAAEGSRTKAAIGASHYGLAIKISSDGDIVVYSDGKPLLGI